MNDRMNMKETLRHVGVKPIAAAIIVILIANIAAAFIGNIFYATEKKVLWQQGELNAKDSAKEYDHCLPLLFSLVLLPSRVVLDQDPSRG